MAVYLWGVDSGMSVTDVFDVRWWHWSLKSLLESEESWDFPPGAHFVVYKWAFIFFILPPNSPSLTALFLLLPSLLLSSPLLSFSRFSPLSLFLCSLLACIWQIIGREFMLNLSLHVWMRLHAHQYPLIMWDTQLFCFGVSTWKHHIPSILA